MRMDWKTTGSSTANSVGPGEASEGPAKEFGRNAAPLSDLAEVGRLTAHYHGLVRELRAAPIAVRGYDLLIVSPLDGQPGEV